MSTPEEYAAHRETVLELIEHPLGSSTGTPEVERVSSPNEVFD